MLFQQFTVEFERTLDGSLAGPCINEIVDVYDACYAELSINLRQHLVEVDQKRRVAKAGRLDLHLAA